MMMMRTQLIYCYLDHIQQIDERKSEAEAEAAAWKLHNDLNLDNNDFDNLATYLLTHPANITYGGRSPSTVTWVLFVWLLRNIVAHENAVNWSGIAACVQQILVYKKKRNLPPNYSCGLVEITAVRFLVTD